MGGACRAGHARGCRTEAKVFGDAVAAYTAEKERGWDSYNRRIPLSETRPPSAAERARFDRIKRKAGRPRVGQGAKVVAVTLESGFLKRVDTYAKHHDMKRAEMITRGLKIVMGE
jgi:hypothetical protein